MQCMCIQSFFLKVRGLNTWWFPLFKKIAPCPYVSSDIGAYHQFQHLYTFKTNVFYRTVKIFTIFLFHGALVYFGYLFQVFFYVFFMRLLLLAVFLYWIIWITFKLLEVFVGFFWFFLKGCVCFYMGSKALHFAMKYYEYDIN